MHREEDAYSDQDAESEEGQHLEHEVAGHFDVSVGFY
jgi:hypothetical protein